MTSWQILDILNRADIPYRVRDGRFEVRLDHPKLTPLLRAEVRALKTELVLLVTEVAQRSGLLGDCGAALLPGGNGGAPVDATVDDAGSSAAVQNPRELSCCATSEVEHERGDTEALATVNRCASGRRGASRTAADVLRMSREHGLWVYVARDVLECSPCDKLTAAGRRALEQHKEELRELLRDSPPAGVAYALGYFMRWDSEVGWCFADWLEDVRWWQNDDAPNWDELERAAVAVPDGAAVNAS